MKYDIIGGSFPVVECTLESGESMKTESGSMVWMSANMDMQTSGSGGLGRLFSGEKIFQNIYTAKGG
ncbi:MAG: AIM24 family protein, partial [Firmicutes bacterium]|nr:AIM24 family protein [Bacillota bacterium]